MSGRFIPTHWRNKTDPSHSVFRDEKIALIWLDSRMKTCLLSVGCFFFSHGAQAQGRFNYSTRVKSNTCRPCSLSSFMFSRVEVAQTNPGFIIIQKYWTQTAEVYIISIFHSATAWIAYCGELRRQSAASYQLVRVSHVMNVHEINNGSQKCSDTAQGTDFRLWKLGALCF